MRVESSQVSYGTFHHDGRAAHRCARAPRAGRRGGLVQRAGDRRAGDRRRRLLARAAPRRAAGRAGRRRVQRLWQPPARSGPRRGPAPGDHARRRARRPARGGHERLPRRRTPAGVRRRRVAAGHGGPVGGAVARDRRLLARAVRLGPGRRRHLPRAAPGHLDLQRSLVRAPGDGHRRQRQGQPRPQPLLVAGDRPGGHHPGAGRADRVRARQGHARVPGARRAARRARLPLAVRGRPALALLRGRPRPAGGGVARPVRRAGRGRVLRPRLDRARGPGAQPRGGHRAIARRPAGRAGAGLMEVRYDAVAKSFGATQALAPLDVTVPDGRFLAMLGPSGCGKTTALRLLAGLELPSAGRIFIGERDVTRLEPRHRDIAMVFQSYALYPHKSVAENIAYPLRLRRSAKAERDERVRKVAELLDIDALLARAPRQLSGGQRQRVALARAIIRRPQAFLMDEPLSNLDAQLRTQMRIEIKRLQRELAVTTLYVTHDQVEAMTMADLIAVMRHGRLQQLATPAELYACPVNLFVARFCGSPPMNVLSGEIADGGFRHAAGTLALPGVRARGRVTLGFRPEHAELAAADAADALAGDIYVVEPLGNETLVTVRIGEDLINVRADADFARPVGERCAVRPAGRHVHLFDSETEEALAHAGAEGTAPVTAGVGATKQEGA